MYKNNLEFLSFPYYFSGIKYTLKEKNDKKNSDISIDIIAYFYKKNNN